MQKISTQKLIMVTVLFMALLALPLVSQAEDGKGLEAIPQTEEKSNGAEDAAKPAYLDGNIEEYLSTLEERGKIQNPVTLHFVVVRALAVITVISCGAAYFIVKYRRRLKKEIR